mmetsp:Transcript_18098/g.30536  ORF Transcript_18098/g.30536 Transcript_18098/m.30536 type:complete len:110 (-) Transcript_18098:85-414(-)
MVRLPPSSIPWRLDGIACRESIIARLTFTIEDRREPGRDMFLGLRPDQVRLFLLYLNKFDANPVGKQRNWLSQENTNLIERHSVCSDVRFHAFVNELSLEVGVKLGTIL